MTGPGKPGACATASTPLPCVSSPSVIWNAKATAPTVHSSSQSKTRAVHSDHPQDNTSLTPAPGSGAPVPRPTIPGTDREPSTASVAGTVRQGRDRESRANGKVTFVVG